MKTAHVYFDNKAAGYKARAFIRGRQYQAEVRTLKRGCHILEMTFPPGEKEPHAIETMREACVLIPRHDPIVIKDETGRRVEPRIAPQGAKTIGRLLGELNLFREHDGSVEITVARAIGLTHEMTKKGVTGAPIDYIEGLIVEAAERIKERRK